MSAFLLLGACNSWLGEKANDEVIASVGKAMLYRSELAASMPSGLDGTDSVSYSQTFISKWIVGQLKLREAEALFSDSEADIEKMVGGGGARVDR